MAVELTIREKCVQAFVAALKNLKTANGYTNQVPDTHIKREEKYPPDPAAFADGNFLFVYEGTEKTVGREHVGRTRIMQELAVTVTEWFAWVQPEPVEGEDAPLELPAALNVFDGEVIKAAMNDQGLNGQGDGVELADEGADDDVLEGEFYIAVRERTFILKYACLEDDPFHQWP